MDTGPAPQGLSQTEAAAKMPNRALWIVLGGVLAWVTLVLYVPLLRELFRFSFLHPIDIAICLSAGAVSILWFEVFKFVRNRRARKGRAVQAAVAH